MLEALVAPDAAHAARLRALAAVVRIVTRIGRLKPPWLGGPSEGPEE
jgi:hypothetical protein